MVYNILIKNMGEIMIDEIRKMPKVELHLHLDGSLSIGLACKLSGLSFKEVFDKMVVSKEYDSLSEYLTKFDFPISLMQTKENLELVAKDLVNRLASQNVIYAEIRFAPMFHTKNGLTYDEIISSILKGLNSNKKIKTNLILCLMRGCSPFDNMKTLDAAYKYLNKGVCAIDLAGDEDKYPLDDYYKYFELAKKRGIPFTIHAGEVKEEEIRKALSLNPKRLGHGITSINDNDLCNLIKAKDVLLEVCPTSNVQTNIVEEYSLHPIKRLYEKEVLLNINTDNSSVSNVTLTEEYIKLYETFDFNLDDFKKMNISAINHAFLSEREKKQLLRMIN